MSALLSATASTTYMPAPTPPQGAFGSAGAGITGGYTGDSLALKISIAFLLGLSLYNAVELVVIVLVTFQRYCGLYFWSLIISALGIMPYSIGFLIKFFQLLDPGRGEGYVAVVFLTIGWYFMITGQSVVLWSRLHLLTSSRRVLRGTLCMIVVNACVLHSVTTVLTFGSNSTSLSPSSRRRFVDGYSIIEKIQMVGFFLQEAVLSIIYIKETLRLLKLSESLHDDVRSFEDRPGNGHFKNAAGRKTMYQLLALNVIIIAMDLALLGVAFANLYLVETTLKGVVYSIKLKLEFAVLGKLVQVVRDRTDSDTSRIQQSSQERRGTSTALALEKTNSGPTPQLQADQRGSLNVVRSPSCNVDVPDFIDPRQVSTDPTHAEPAVTDDGWETRRGADQEKWRRRRRLIDPSWIDEDMDRYNIG